MIFTHLLQKDILNQLSKKQRHSTPILSNDSMTRIYSRSFPAISKIDKGGEVVRKDAVVPGTKKIKKHESEASRTKKKAVTVKKVSELKDLLWQNKNLGGEKN